MIPCLRLREAVTHPQIASFQTPSHAALTRFAIPVMLAATATPLMGLVDTAVLGRLGDPAIIAAAGIGGTIFTVVGASWERPGRR
jgi:Na+-driven multidrug efflux pump